jgi:hypothetical protein
VIAQLAVETGIPPREFLEMDNRMFRSILMVLRDRAKEIENVRRNKRGFTAS